LDTSPSNLCKFVDAVGEGLDIPRVSLDMFDVTSSLEAAAEFLYPEEALQIWTELCLRRAFLSPRNVLVDDFNDLVLAKLPGEMSMNISCFLSIAIYSALMIPLLQCPSMHRIMSRLWRAMT
jgi:hypothetical protein